MARQLRLDLPVRPALGHGDFFVSPSNAQAMTLIETWRDWPERKLLIVGPTGAGKTHLAHVWAGLCGGRIVAAGDLARLDVSALACGTVAVEDVCRIAGDAASEEALFHLHNLALAEGHALLLSAREVPQRWPLVLPDLASRMQGTLIARLDPPDDALLGAVLVKLFADRQIAPSPDTVPFLVRRMERSFEAARLLVAALDDAALATRRPVTRALAAEVLDKSTD